MAATTIQIQKFVAFGTVYQCRTLNNIYTLKQKEGGTFTLKVRNLAQVCLLKKTVTLRNVEDISISVLRGKGILPQEELGTAEGSKALKDLTEQIDDMAQKPAQLATYISLAKLLESPQEKAQLLLKGACQALNKDDQATARELIEEAQNYSEGSFLDQMLVLFPYREEKLKGFAREAEEGGNLRLALKAYKMLSQIEQTPSYTQKVIETYEKLSLIEPTPPTVRAPVFPWYLRRLKELTQNIPMLLTVDHANHFWSSVEELTFKAIEATRDTHDYIAICGFLETVYMHGDESKLDGLWYDLGQAYLAVDQVGKAEETYQKAFDRFQTFRHAFALAKTFKKGGYIQESVQTYYEASPLALLEGIEDGMAKCIKGIRKIDPKMSHLDTSAKLDLLTQAELLPTTSRISTLDGRTTNLEWSLIKLREDFDKSMSVISFSMYKIREEMEVLKARIDAQAETLSEEIRLIKGRSIAERNEMIYGRNIWKKYFGLILEEPSLPKDLEAVLNSDSPFAIEGVKGTKIKDTHLLVLVPESLSLNSLQKLAKSPFKGAPSTKYRHNYHDEHGEVSTVASRWILISKGLIEESRNTSYPDQEKMIEAHEGYTIPPALDVAAALLIHHAATKKKLYSGVKTFTRCAETVEVSGNHMVVGGFRPDGLGVCEGASNGSRYNDGIAAYRNLSQ